MCGSATNLDLFARGVLETVGIALMVSLIDMNRNLFNRT
jgi:hypothetical protein